jgi:hypothetical protein
MKCVKNIETNEVVRTFEERAESYVKTGKFIYVPKKEWKDNGRKRG